jgi:hypothetical protein
MRIRHSAISANRSASWPSKPLLIFSAIAALAACVGCGDSKPPVPNAYREYIAARDFLTAGERDKALEALNASIQSEPTTWALLERAKLHAHNGDDAAARDDCEAGLALVPEDPDLLWLQGELQKPAAERFQGKFKSPPSANR